MKHKKLYLALAAAFSALFLFSAGMALSSVLESRAQEAAFARLAEQAAQAAAQAAQAAPPSASEVPEEEPLPSRLEGYAALHGENPDLFGWVKIEGTKLDYPVMFTPEDPEYYLRRAFDGSYSVAGVPFLDGDCQEDGNHYLVYGHHMKNGTMFGSLPGYANEDYWAEHPAIQFDTLDEEGGYEVLAAFYSEIYPVDAEGVFRYYEYADLSDPERFTEYVEQAKAAALYDTGIAAQYGDRLLTLSTCSYHTDNGRFVVVARKAA
ncbi:class B sortase [Flavonifractor sp. An100]|uniref:class B sortase n=1 Tax=Flavonifractor sp. An100 TaxID=1965538 RepID=UPI000B54CDA9|nr:class B sortase [Flavonifractor sp. An100]OUQ75818.1 hypothetical protein B5E43_13270 [Flavonifractor sp. An100]